MTNKAHFTAVFTMVTPQKPPVVGFLAQLPLPEGESFVVVRRESRMVGSIITTNDQGQRINTARSTGTDRKNKEDIKASILDHGIHTSSQPPYIFADGRLIDGYTRMEAIEELGFDEWTFNIVQVKPGYTEEQVREEIGLGANDHPPAKGATRKDYLAGMKRFIVRYKAENGGVSPSKYLVMDWMAGIPHSYTDNGVSGMAEAALKQVDAGETMESTTAAETLAWAAKHVHLREGESFVAFNGSGSSTYFKRAVVDVLREHGNGHDPVMVGYLNDIPADEAEEVREAASEQIDEINALFEKAYQKRKRMGKSFKFCDLRGFRAQIIDKEDADELV